MTNQQILEKAIQKAIGGGWSLHSIANGWGIDDSRRPVVDEDGNISQYDGDDEWITLAKEALIFNHDFAKALWGDKFINPELRDDSGSRVIAMQQTAWKHHLRQMVIADNPIKYLGENI